jgi:hypothetical protein
MNANELADELEGFGYLNSDDGLHFCPFQAQVDMLRQQQAEIKELKKYFEAWKFLNNGIICLGTNARAILKKAQDK